MKKTIMIVICVCVVSAFLCAFDSTSWTVMSVETEKNDTITTISGSSGQTIRVVSAYELTVADSTALVRAFEAISSIPSLQFINAAVRMDADGFKIAVHPSHLMYDEVDLQPYLPAGLAFYYKDFLRYDILLKIDGLMPNVSGAFVDGADLLKLLVATVRSPDMYMIDSNLLMRIERLENALMALSKKSLFSKPAPVSRDIVYAVLSLHNEDSALTKQDAAKKLKAQGINASTADIDAVFLLYIDTIE